MNISGIGPSFGGFTYNPIKLNTDINTDSRNVSSVDNIGKVSDNLRTKPNSIGAEYSAYNQEGFVRLKAGSAQNTVAVRGAENFDF